ncbi:hypothetical protein [uncultured Sulfitobacter sp.]|uniref:hypothetical protein n=1 Tax=uncultured Sulfitobacter sp. TaxID=191468 RepID=UPI00262C25FA|nr:hypothetical protein [uncultured Sulfitobacter sp.]
MEKLRASIICSLAFLAAIPSWADSLSCSNSVVTTSVQQAEHGELVCSAVEQAAVLFDQCNVPALSSPVHISVVDQLKPGCVALYHCGEGRIEVLSPPNMQELRDPDGAFIHLGIDEYFQSVVIHELSHAATYGIPCPFEECVTAHEYIAYAMQVMSLSSEAQSIFEDRSGLDRSISSDELSAIILFMAPHLFSQKVWGHLSQRKDPCGYIGQIVDGSVLLDRERF